MNDTWYRATRPYGNTTTFLTTGLRNTFIPKDAASPMGCVEQWQWCKGLPASNSDADLICGPLGSQVDAMYGAAHLFNLQPSAFDPARPFSNSTIGSSLVWPSIIALFNPTTLDTALQYLGARSLTSQTRLYGGVQWSLPDDQWKLDVVNWWSTLLSSIQASFINTVLGPSDAVFQSIRLPPLNGNEVSMCASQVTISLYMILLPSLSPDYTLLETCCAHCLTCILDNP